MNNIESSFPKFSFYHGPITNKRPGATLTLVDVYRGLTTKYYEKTTKKVRESNSPEVRRKAKQNLDYVTFAGTFSTRKKEGVICKSGYICIDFDHIEPEMMNEIRTVLLNDDMFETQLLFVSPSGTGLKWIVEVDLISFPEYEINFLGIVAYLRRTYPKYFNVSADYIDETGKDVSRACFLCYDPKAFINPKYANHGN